MYSNQEPENFTHLVLEYAAISEIFLERKVRGRVKKPLQYLVQTKMNRYPIPGTSLEIKKPKPCITSFPKKWLVSYKNLESGKNHI